ncbi:MAG: hypothetical protein NZ958_01865 [Bacteroidia bacterium]|nr:hypothetical protein [Bacteroidia bacterium]MDW8089089.1 hypothetical protein [Bacteroidia bacterium]
MPFLLSAPAQEELSRIFQKLLLRLGWGLWIYFALLSLRFAQERAFWYDWSYLLYRLVALGDIAIDHQRYAHLLAHGPTWLGVKLGLPFRVVVALFSLGYLLVGFLGFIVVYRLARTLEEKCLAFLPALPYLLSRDVFYSTNSATLALSLAGSSTAIWLMAFQRTSHRRYFYLALGLSLAVAGLFFAHPISGFALLEGALLTFFLSDQKDRWLGASLLGLTLTLVALKYFVFLTGYEATKAVPLSELLPKLRTLFTEGFMASRMGLHLRYFYPFHHPFSLIVVALVGLYLPVGYGWRGLGLLLAIGSASLAAALYLAIYLWQGEHPAAMEFYGLGVIVLLGVGTLTAIAYLKRPSEKIIASLFTAGMVMENAIRIGYSARTLELSLGHTRRLVESCRKEGEFKAILHFASLTPEFNYYVWTAYAWSMSSLLYAASLGRDSIGLFVLTGDIADMDSLARATHHTYVLGPPWKPLEVQFARLNPRYFRVPDGPYQILTHPQTSVVYEALESGKLRLWPKDTLLRISRQAGYSSGYTIAEVYLFQDYAERLPCLPTDSVAVGISYEIYDKEGKRIMQHYPFNNWERDLPRRYVQGVFVPMEPEYEGRYWVQFGFWSRKHGFIPSGPRVPLIVR